MAGMADGGQPQPVRRELAAALSNLAIQHSAAGRTAEAVAAAEEAVAILRELAQGEIEAPPSVQTAAPVTTNGLAGLLAAGYGRVLALAVARILVPRRRSWPGVVVASASAGIAASWPLLAELALYALRRDDALVTPDAIGWVVALAIVTTAALVVSWRAWFMVERAGASLDELLAGSAGEQRLLRWFRRSLRRGRQVVLSMLVAGGACALLYLAQPAIADRLEIGPVSYLSVGWTAFVLGNDAYWLLTVSRLGRRILHQPDLNLVWHSPASTPGIVALSRGYTFGTVAILFLAIGVELLALRVSTYGDSVVLQTVAITFPVLAAVAALIFGVLPHWWLYLAVRDARHRVLRALVPQARRPPANAAELADAQSRIGLYNIVESSAGLPFSTGAMVQYAAAVLSTLVGTLLVIVLGLR